MRPYVLALALAPLALSACEVAHRTAVATVITPVTPAQTAACIEAAASARNVAQALVTAPSATASTAGPVLTLNVNGEPATCTVSPTGQVLALTFG